MIKATDALGTLSDELQSEHREAERIIDRRIKAMDDDEELSVNLQDITRSMRVLRRLERAYVDGGWDVTVEPVDERGAGPFFRLRVASPPAQRSRGVMMKGVDYASGTVPPDYRCGTCGAHGCRLWRQRAPGPPGLLCAACAFSGDRFESLVPAVPCEDGTGFWTVKGAPVAGVTWWKALPMALPQRKPREFKTSYGVDASGDR